MRHETQKRFNDCKNKQPLPFDFYINNTNIIHLNDTIISIDLFCIEYDGEQHFRSIEFFGG